MYSYKLLNTNHLDNHLDSGIINNEHVNNIAYNASNTEHFETCMRCSTCGQERQFEFQVHVIIIFNKLIRSFS